MNRIIRFRGIPKGGGKFVYGNLVRADDGVFIVEEGGNLEFQEPEYHKSGMGCGLEDRGITDRYEAMAHGFERAVEKCAELYPDMTEVDPKTVGQYIGLPGKDIFEGDIVRAKHQKIAKVVWSTDLACFATETVDQIVKGELLFCLRDIEEVIGNIYETPELLHV